ncbi:alanine/ornithine racemase family PLP-dependent enzyme [Nocardioides bigeumensis]|uniref:Alanine racemase N-terminal domain-containing protein n=1 Tax=Nocardioides bigeumensis TaxID=433657 RepID=A0ABN2XPC4_9ACTN
MSAPRLEVDLEAIEANTRVLAARLGSRGIGITGVTKAVLGSPAVASAMLRGGAVGLADSRVENLARLAAGDVESVRTLIRSPMLSQVDAVVRVAGVSLHSEPTVLEALSAAAGLAGTTHSVVLMLELGDLREGVLGEAMTGLARTAASLPHLRLVGVGTNLACQSGVAPDQDNMGELSSVVAEVEAATDARLSVISGGNSASLGWALRTTDVGRVNELRLGEALLLGRDPLTRMPLAGLRQDAFILVGELIEVQSKPAQPWGRLAQSAFGAPPARLGTGSVRQGIVALGRQDVESSGLVPPDGVRVLGMSSDHLVLDLGDSGARVGDELRFGVDYGGLLRAATSPFVETVDGSCQDVIRTEPSSARIA